MKSHVSPALGLAGCLLTGACLGIEVPIEDTGRYAWCVTGAAAEPAPHDVTPESVPDTVGEKYDIVGSVEEISVDTSNACGNHPMQVLTIRDNDNGVSKFHLYVLDADDDLDTPKLPLAIGGKVHLVASRTRMQWSPIDETVVIDDDLGLALAFRSASFESIGQGHHTESGLRVWEAGRDEYFSGTCAEGYTYNMKFVGSSSVILSPNERGRFPLAGYTFEARNIRFSRVTNVHGCTDVGGGSGSWLVVRRW